MEEVINKTEELGAQRITLEKSLLIGDPWIGDAIEGNGVYARGEEGGNLSLKGDLQNPKHGA